MQMQMQNLFPTKTKGAISDHLCLEGDRRDSTQCEWQYTNIRKSPAGPAVQINYLEKSNIQVKRLQSCCARRKTFQLNAKEHPKLKKHYNRKVQKMPSTPT